MCDGEKIYQASRIITESEYNHIAIDQYVGSFVVLPEFVPSRWWHTFLHNASGWLLRLRLHYRRDIVVTSVRYYLD